MKRGGWLLSFCAGVAAGAGIAVAAIDWPADKVFPRFAAYGALDVADITGSAFDRKAAFATLQGLVNRSVPRIYLLDGNQSGEGKTFWSDKITATKNTVADPLSLFAKYRADVAGLCVYDPALPGTINATVTAAGVLGCVVASPAMEQALSAAPYGFKTILDLRNRGFANDRAAMAWARSEYWARCNHRMLAGFKPGVHFPLMDYAVANKAMSVWLDTENPADRALLDSLFKDMPANGVYVGWWAGETSGVGYASGYGVATFASDWFCNATVHGGDTRVPAALPMPPAPPALGNKIYIALILSDGDNLQEQEHLFPNRWKNARRGTFPVSWTQSPALADFAPDILSYYYSTRTPNDCFISGPSGVGYVRPEKMSREHFQGFASLTESYLKRTGIRAITVWGNASWASDAYGLHCASLIGIANKQGGSAPMGQKYWSGGLPSVEMAPDYASFASQIIPELNGRIAAWDRKRPLFLAPQLNANVAGLDELKLVVDAFAGVDDVEFVRADQLFQLMRSANPGPVGLAPSRSQPGLSIFPLPGAAFSDALGRSLSLPVPAQPPSL